MSSWLSFLVLLLLSIAGRTTALVSNFSTSTTEAHSSANVGDYVLKGMDAEGSQPGSTTVPAHSTTSDTSVVTTGGTSSASRTPIRAAQQWSYVPPNATTYVAVPTSNYPVYGDEVTLKPNSGTGSHASSTAMQCWSEIATWRNQSASFWDANVANRTWDITSVSFSTSATWSAITTLYPANVSTYTLCDGSPRADVRPTTTFLSGTTTLFGSTTSTLTPTFRPQPCTLEKQDCRMLYQDTNILDIDDRELLRQCGSPAHGGEEKSCLIGGGPVDLIYFPVQRNDSGICVSKTHATSNLPLVPGISEIITLGRTFTSDSVYISFKTLYATYDGFWDHVGPTFTDLIVPLHSSDISSHCGGWHNAYGTGTPLDYADLNWPVPASAYSCQNRCPSTYTKTATLLDDSFHWQLVDIPIPPECKTIWSDINPILALPTKIRDMVPEWSTCSFWNDNLANFWFDPPLALKPAEVAASITRPSESEATSAAQAAPSSLPSSPLAHITHSPSTEAAAPTTTAKPSSSAVDTSPVATVNAPEDSSVDAEEVSSGPVAQVSNHPDEPTQDFNPSSPESVYSGVPASDLPAMSTESRPNEPTFVFNPPDKPTVKGETLQIPPTLNPVVATAAAFSILTQALSSHQVQQTESIDAPGANAATSSTGTSLTPLQGADGAITLGSTTLAVSGIQTNPKASASAVAIDAIPIASGTMPTVLTQQAPFLALIIDGQTLSAGGPAATIAGQVLTAQSDGLLVVGTATEVTSASLETLPSVIIPSTISPHTNSGGVAPGPISTFNGGPGNSSATKTTSSRTGDGSNVEGASSATSTLESAGLRSMPSIDVLWLFGAAAGAWLFGGMT